MLVGAMNHPARDVIEEITWMVALELEFIDLTLEPPAAASWRVNAKDIRRALDDFDGGLDRILSGAAGRFGGLREQRQQSSKKRHFPLLANTSRPA